jgi:hypothetical protein
VVVVGAFPWIGMLGPDGTAAWQWNGEDRVTTGGIQDAVQARENATCTVGTESWKHVPGASACSPDGCDALTVRCLDANGKEVWVYQHRSELSSGSAIVVDGTRALFVAGTLSRDPQLSTGTRVALFAFDP